MRAIWVNSPEAAGWLLKLIGKEFPRLDAGDLQASVEDAVGAVGLTHDIGHPPFSHVLEPFFHRRYADWFQGQTPAPWRSYSQVQRDFHEFAGHVLLHRLAGEVSQIESDTGAYSAFISLVLRIATADPNGDEWSSVLHGLVAGEIDVDRLDYVMRDAQRAGTEFGSVDYIRLVDSIELHETDAQHRRFSAGPGATARSAAETLLVQRVQSYRWITFHHQVTAANAALGAAVELLFEFSEDESPIDLPELGTVQLSSVYAFDQRVVDYLNPTRLRTAILHGPTRDGSESSDLQLSAANDGLVVRLLFEGLGVTDFVLEHGVVDEALRKRLRQFDACARAALLREKRLVPAWKTMDEWRRFVQHYLFNADPSEPEPPGMKLARDLREVIETALDGHGEDSPEHLYLTRVGLGTVALLDRPGDRILAMNRILDQVMLDTEAPEQLVQSLASTPGELKGWMKRGAWIVTHQTFTALRPYDAHPAGLFYQSDYTPLRKGSPLIESLEEAERHRIKTTCFFVVHERDEVFDLSERNMIRPALKHRVVEVLPNFLLDMWPDRLIRLASRYAQRAREID